MKVTTRPDRRKRQRVSLPSPKTLRYQFIVGRGRALLAHPLFPLLTLVGNGAILVGAIAVYHLERFANPKMTTFLDALWWSMATVTTVGYGDVCPVTPWGRIVGMVLMIAGTAVFGCFTALFATVLMEPELEAEMRDLERELKD